jgi:hypothetical protein
MHKSGENDPAPLQPRSYPGRPPRKDAAEEPLIEALTQVILDIFADRGRNHCQAGHYCLIDSRYTCWDQIYNYAKLMCPLVDECEPRSSAKLTEREIPRNVKSVPKSRLG